MNNKIFSLALLALAAVLNSNTTAVAQMDYYHSPAYQAEEQAFRARQNEGARLHEMYGENSPQYGQWHLQEKGRLPGNNFGYGYPYAPGYGYGYAPGFGYAAPNYGRLNYYSSSFHRPHHKVKTKVKVKHHHR